VTVATLRAIDDPIWQAVLERVPTDVYHLPAWLALAERHEEGRVVVVHARDAAGETVLPLLLRPLPAELDRAATGGLDASSPYGYPAPLTELRDPAALRGQWQAIGRALRAAGVVAAFVRLHPLLTRPTELELLAGLGELVHHGETVWLDLGRSEAEAQAAMRPNHRRDLARSHRAGWRVEVAPFAADPAFTALYQHTMCRRGAGAFYLFPQAYFDDLARRLAGRAHLATAFGPAGEVGAMALALEAEGILQYHLGATDPRHARPAPMKQALDGLRRWGSARGLRVLHLGGGVGGRADALFHFKAGFSELRAPARTFRWVLDAARHDRLRAVWQDRHGPGAQPPAGFFPPWRARPVVAGEGPAGVAGAGRGP
jgi:hypothetical protein